MAFCVRCDREREPVVEFSLSGMIHQCPECRSPFSMPERRLAEAVQVAEVTSNASSNYVRNEAIRVAQIHPEVLDAASILERAKLRLAVVKGEIAKLEQCKREEAMLERMIMFAESSEV